jgi:hypothetical protein
VRFVPKSDSSIVLIGEPVDESLDVGKEVSQGHEVQVNVFSGTSALESGQPTGSQAVIDCLLSPLAAKEVGTIRCIGLNVCSVKTSTRTWFPS